MLLYVIFRQLLKLVLCRVARPPPRTSSASCCSDQVAILRRTNPGPRLDRADGHMRRPGELLKLGDRVSASTIRRIPIEGAPSYGITRARETVLKRLFRIQSASAPQCSRTRSGS